MSHRPAEVAKGQSLLGLMEHAAVRRAEQDSRWCSAPSRWTGWAQPGVASAESSDLGSWQTSVVLNFSGEVCFNRGFLALGQDSSFYCRMFNILGLSP